MRHEEFGAKLQGCRGVGTDIDRERKMSSSTQGMRVLFRRLRERKKHERVRVGTSSRRKRSPVGSQPEPRIELHAHQSFISVPLVRKRSTYAFQSLSYVCHRRFYVPILST